MFSPNKLSKLIPLKVALGLLANVLWVFLFASGFVFFLFADAPNKHLILYVSCLLALGVYVLGACIWAAKKYGGHATEHVQEYDYDYE